MSSRCPDRRTRLAEAAAFVAGTIGASLACAQPPLRVCAEPANLPYSHVDGSGFENAIAKVVADELGRPLEYHWLPNRRGFVRKTLNARECDVIIGVPKAFELVRTTRPYYASTYVFVQRAGGGPRIASFGDEAIGRVRVGIPLVADDMAATPPGHALVHVGAIANVTGYPIDGDGTQGERIVGAVASGVIDVGVVWGPQAGYYARRQHVALALERADAPPGLAGIPFQYSIAMGVRKDDVELQQALDGAIERRRAEIDEILRRYGVPRTDGAAKS